MGYSFDEQETTLVFDYLLGKWSVYSSVPKHIRRLEKLCDLTILESENGKPIAVKGVLAEKQVSMRKAIELTDEQKQQRRERILQTEGMRK